MVVLDPEHAPDVMSDAQLVADAQRGSTAAFAALYERHHPRILGHCRNRIGGNDAADAAQETFLRAWRALDGFGGDGRVYPWLRTIATNVCIDTLRRRSRSVPVAEVDVAPVVDEVDLEALAVHTDAMTEALARLSDRHRSVLQLREYEGWTYERIAAHEQLDLSAVKSLLWRARQSLRREFFLVSAQGRLSALAGVLSLGRLRDLLSQVGVSGAQLGAGGTVAAATAVAAVVAVPTLTSAPVPAPAVPPPVVVVTTVPPTTAPITVHTGGRRTTVRVARVAPTTAAPAVEAASTGPASVEVAAGPTTTSTSTTTSTVPTASGASAPTEAPAAPTTKEEAKAARERAKERAASAREAARAESEAAKEQAKAAKERAEQQAESAREAAKAKAEAARDAARVRGRSEGGRRATVELTTTTTTTPPSTTTTTTEPQARDDRRDRDHDEGDRSGRRDRGRS